MQEISKKYWTVKEVSEILGVSVYTVKRCIRRTMPNKMQNGKTTELNELEFTIVSKELKNNLYSKVQLTCEAGAQVENTKTRLEILYNYKQASDEIIALLNSEKEALELRAKQAETKLIEQAPKVSFYDTVSNSGKNLTMQETAKLLKLKNIGRNNLFFILRQHKILDEKNSPYQKYIDSGYFVVIENTFLLPNGNQGVSLKTLTTQKGLQYLHSVLSAKNLLEVK